MIEINGLHASLDFVLSADQYHPVVISYYDRSLAIVKSIGASISTSNMTFYIGSKRFGTTGEYDTIISPIITGKDKFYHAMAISKSLNADVMVCKNGYQEISFYNFLMHNFNLPLMKEWANELYTWCLENRYIKCDDYLNLIRGHNSVSADLSIGSEKIKLDELRVYLISLNELALQNCVKVLFQRKKIWISKISQKNLSFTNMDTYFKLYGKSLVENLEKTIKPLSELNGNINDFTLKHMRLFPQQAAQVNGDLELLDHSSYAILNEGMGTGKTIQGASICEGYFVRKYLRSHPGKSLRDAYLKEDIINYRNIVMCPGHLVSKWAEQIKNEIPYARVTILNDFKQLLEIKKRGIKRKGKEYFIISKDFAKLSYQKKPTPTKRRYGNIMKKMCKDCGCEIFTAENECTNCHSTNIQLVKTGYKAEGMVCPECNNILIPYKTAKLQQNLDEGEYTNPLDFYDFTNQCDSNSHCYYCGAELWQPHVANIGDVVKSNKWYRATHYANKAHKNTKTVWVHKDFAKAYFEYIGEEPLNEIDSDIYRGSRKVAPGVYIKKHLKGYFDFAIFDEVHLFKSGSSAQANCMSALISASKKHLALTGTIAGGMANHIFYLIYRLDPRRMKQAGYEWTDEIKFIEKYGVLETSFECKTDEGSEQYNASSKGRQKGSPSIKPGISPLIFMDFLLDKTVFLDLSDMSHYLPPLKEIVELVDIPETIENQNGDVIENIEVSMINSYRTIIGDLRKLSRTKEGGKGILSTMLQFSLSYLDKPYGVSAIRSPKTGATLAIPEDYSIYADKNTLLSKEKRLVYIVNKELNEKRNIVIFAEYTGSPETCVSYRLKELIETHCHIKGKVEVLESSYPSASKREEWIHKKAEEGCKVIITNPRNVETGLECEMFHNEKLWQHKLLDLGNISE